MVSESAHDHQAGAVPSALPGLPRPGLPRPGLPRAGLPEELAGAALLLTDPQSSYLTGVVLPVDGGWTAH